MTRPLHAITTAMQIYREGDDPIYGETVISIRVEDESGGWYFVIDSEVKAEDGGIKVELDELRKLLECAEELAKQEPQK